MVKPAAKLAGRRTGATTNSNGAEVEDRSELPAGTGLDAFVTGLERGIRSPLQFSTLQRLVGNHAIGKLMSDSAQRQRLATGPGDVQRAPGPKTPKPRAPSFDEIAQEIGSALGGPYADYAAFAATMVSGDFLGHKIERGVRSEFLAKLKTAEKAVNDEFTKSGKTIPPGFGISTVGGFRSRAGPHGWGLAIDIDVASNPFVMHEHGESKLDAQLGPVYNRIAEFILNSPINGEQSIIPKLITQTGKSLSGGTKSRRDMLMEYYDRLALESQAMIDYFRVMKDPDPKAIANFLAGPWQKTHPSATPPSADDVRRQMWEDYATLGGQIPKGGPPGVTGFKAPGAIDAKADRPFAPNSGSPQDPGKGFLTIPREVVVGLGRTVTRWGAIDFGGESGDVQHFDDMGGLGTAIAAATAKAQAKINAGPTAAAETGGHGEIVGEKALASVGSGQSGEVGPAAAEESGASV